MGTLTTLAERISPTAFAVSTDLPPPIPMITSAPNSFPIFSILAISFSELSPLKPTFSKLRFCL